MNLRPELAATLKRIAVLDFVDAPGADAGHSGQVVAGIVGSTALEVCGWSLMERRQLSRIIEEQDLQQTDLVDPTTAVRVGKLAGADGVIIGEVGQYRIASIPFLFFVTWDQDVYKVDFTFRLIDVSTGEVCASAHASATSLRSFDAAVTEGAQAIFREVDKQLLGGSRLVK